MKVKKAIALLCATTMVMSMAACGSKSDSGKSDNKAATTTSKTDGDALVVKYSVVFPATGTQADGANALADIIEEESDGRMKMEFYPSSQLGDKVSTLEGLQAERLR